SRKFLAVITAGISLRSAGSQAGMMTWTLLPNGGDVTRCEAVWAKREEDGPATPPAPAGLTPSGWKAGGGTEPHATTSAPTPASKAPRGPRHIRRPPLVGCHGQRGTLPTAPSRPAGPAEPTGPAGEVTRPAGEPVTPAGELLAHQSLASTASVPLAPHSAGNVSREMRTGQAAGGDHRDRRGEHERAERELRLPRRPPGGDQPQAGQRRQHEGAEQPDRQGRHPEPAEVEAEHARELHVAPAEAARMDEGEQREEQPGRGQAGQGGQEASAAARDGQRARRQQQRGGRVRGQG